MAASAIIYMVAEGEIPIVASHGAEIEAYSAHDPAVRVVILKALCDIRVEMFVLQQEDIRNYIDSSIKQGIHLSAFRKERIGGDSYGISYWYKDDPIIGHRLYREIRKVEVKKGKGKNVCLTLLTSGAQLQLIWMSSKMFPDQDQAHLKLILKIFK